MCSVHVFSYPCISGQPGECLFTYFCVHLHNTKLMSDWVGMEVMFAYILQFIKIIRIAVLMAPLINMTFKVHPINCYVHFCNTSCCLSKCTSYRVYSKLFQVAGVIIDQKVCRYIRPLASIPCVYTCIVFLTA